uniref:Ig-like domain-containing protein n=1 Tax=Amphilophus citrinellus TaxID=61819 RepID=A0A3Q0SI55_AMPCI
THFNMLCMALIERVIQTQQTVLAAVGEDAEFSCQLLETKDVLQVTWQKISRDVETNVATYNKYFGQRVNDGFTDKFKFKYTGLQNCSIIIRNVTEQDNGCYRCLFNTFPEGSFIGKPCLHVYGKELWVVSCSATGRPAPTVTLSVSQQHLNFSQYNTVSVSNTNATFTVTTTAVLSGSRRNSTQVGCSVLIWSVFKFTYLSVFLKGIRISVISTSVLLVCCVAALIFVRHRQTLRAGTPLKQFHLLIQLINVFAALTVNLNPSV